MRWTTVIKMIDEDGVIIEHKDADQYYLIKKITEKTELNERYSIKIYTYIMRRTQQLSLFTNQ